MARASARRPSIEMRTTFGIGGGVGTTATGVGTAVGDAAPPHPASETRTTMQAVAAMASNRDIFLLIEAKGEDINLPHAGF